MSATTGPAAREPGYLPLFDAGGEEEFDPWPGWAAPHLPAHPKVTIERLEAELRRLLKPGLPATARTVGDVLPNLRSVVARSVHPYDPVSRVDSLNRLLVRMLVERDDGSAARILFAIAKGTRGTTLTARRGMAARALSYEVTHFRKQIEPKLLEELATALYTDLLRYKRRVRRSATSEEPTGDTPSITADDFTHEEELVSRIWQYVYGWRAELIAVGRLEGQPGYESQVEDHRRAAAQKEAGLRALVAEYSRSYGSPLVPQGDAEYSAEGLARLLQPSPKDAADDW